MQSDAELNMEKGPRVHNSLFELRDIILWAEWTRPDSKITSQPTSHLPGHMLRPLLQSRAVKAIVNPNDHSASRHTQAHTHPGRSSLQGSWQNRRRRGLVRRQHCRCAPPAHWFLRLEEPEGTAITHLLSMAHTQCTQINRQTHTIHTHTCLNTHTHAPSCFLLSHPLHSDPVHFLTSIIYWCWGQRRQATTFLMSHHKFKIQYTHPMKKYML